jgi:hypothetical protein
VNATRLPCGEFVEICVVNLCTEPRPVPCAPKLERLETWAKRMHVRKDVGWWPEAYYDSWVSGVLLGLFAVLAVVWALALRKGTAAYAWGIVLLAFVIALAFVAVRITRSRAKRVRPQGAAAARGPMWPDASRGGEKLGSLQISCKRHGFCPSFVASGAVYFGAGVAAPAGPACGGTASDGGGPLQSRTVPSHLSSATRASRNSDRLSAALFT